MVRVIRIHVDGRMVAIVIHGPSSYETAMEFAEELEREGYEVIRLNTGNELDEKLAEEIENLIDKLLA